MPPDYSDFCGLEQKEGKTHYQYSAHAIIWSNVSVITSSYLLACLVVLRDISNFLGLLCHPTIST